MYRKPITMNTLRADAVCGITFSRHQYTISVQSPKYCTLIIEQDDEDYDDGSDCMSPPPPESCILCKSVLILYKE